MDVLVPVHILQKAPDLLHFPVFHEAVRFSLGVSFEAVSLAGDFFAEVVNC